MKSILAIYVGAGKFESRGPADMETADRNFRIGQTVKLNITRPRSSKQLNYFFAWLKEVFENLPETLPDDAPPRFKDTEHLRAWLIYKAGRADVWSYPRDQVNRQAINMMRRVARGHLFFEVTETTVWVFEPQSIAIENMGHEEFTELFDKIKELAIYLIPGLDLEKLDAHVRKEHTERSR